MMLGSKKLNSVLTEFGLFLCAFLASAENFGDKLEVVEDSKQKFFITEIFEKYGNDNYITYEGFEHLLENLGLGKLKFETKHDVSIHKINGTFLEFHDELLLHKHNHLVNSEDKKTEKKEKNSERKKRNVDFNETDDLSADVGKILRRKCLTAQDILTTFGLQPYHDVVITPSNYLKICPAIVYELDQKKCKKEEVRDMPHKQENYHLVWIYASTSIIVMGVSGMLCVLIVPVVKKNYFKSLLQGLVSLAAGTLCGDAIIHLLPQVFSANNQSSDPTAVLRGTVTLLAIILFFVIDNILTGIHVQRNKIGKTTNENDKMLSDTVQQEFHGHAHDMKEISTTAWMAIIGDILHNFTDGLSIGAAFASSLSSGFASSIAIFCHELPHELGDYAILLASGISVKKSLFYNFVSSAFSFAGMTAGVILGDIHDASLWINAFTAGSFLYIALATLLPEMKKINSSPTTSTIQNFVVQMLGLTCGGILMFTIALFEDQIENMLN